MSALRGLARACHPAPTLAVTALVCAFGAILGWRGGGLALVGLAVLTGQLSVGWVNDAHDARLDRAQARTAKPVVAGLIAPRALWAAALAALAASAALSWLAAGWLGGSLHVWAVAWGWIYTLGLSRTPLSWLPYALAFGALPGFLAVGLGEPGAPLWLTAAFAITAVGAHLGNALPDVARDRAAGVGGLAVSLGERRAALLCWALTGAGTGIVAVEALPRQPWLAAVIALAWLAAALLARSGRASAFHALLALVGLDVAAIALALALG
ncbi:MAG: UbiA family prenyltransferase [Actinomycetota bacterium]